MATHLLTGTRIREKRMGIGMRQADLAQTAGISPSYLNLIEHNKRRIGGKLLGDLARALSVDVAALTEGAEAALLDRLRLTAADLGAPVEMDRIEEFATRYPGWAGLIEKQADLAQTQAAQIRVLTDRMANDPHLAAALHDVISAVTSIRSTAAILVGDDLIDADWQRRFHKNIHDESVRLGDVSDALIANFSGPTGEGDAANGQADTIGAFLAAFPDVIPAIEADPTRDVQDTWAEQIARYGAQRAEIAAYLAEYATLARVMPNPAFAAYAKAVSHDPLAISRHYGCDFGDVLKRLATLRTDDGHPPMGLATCDASGAITAYSPVAGFKLSRVGGACPLWPLFMALSQPERPLRSEVVLPDAAQTRLLCYAIAQPHTAATYDAAPVMSSTMLVMPDPPEGDATPQPIGTSCRICPRMDCASRRRPSVVSPLQSRANGL